MSITDPLARLESLIAQAEAKFGPREPVALTAVGFARVFDENGTEIDALTIDRATGAPIGTRSIRVAAVE